MKILSVFQLNNNLITKNQQITQNNEYISKPVNLNYLPNNYKINISFQATNIEIIKKMTNLTKSGNYKKEKLMKLFNEMSTKAKWNAEEAVNKFKGKGLKLDKQKYLEACLKQPSLFCQSPDTIKSNVIGVIEKFKEDGLNLDKQKYLEACLKQPPLFCQSPDTIKSNVIGVIEKFKEDGFELDKAKYLDVCLKQPSLFFQSPDTIKSNVIGVIEKFKEDGLNLDKQKYLDVCLKQPSLFFQSPDTRKSNVVRVIEKFKEDGFELDKQKYLEACLKQPQLFCQSPDTIKSNVIGVIEKFKEDGFELDKQKYLDVCLKQPPLFCQSPDTITEKIRAYMYVDKNKLGYQDKNIIQKVLVKILTYSTSLIYLQNIILPQLKKQSSEISKWETSKLKPNLKKYFENNPDKKFTIKILKDDKMSDNFIKVIKEYCQKDLGRDDMFNILVA